NPLVRRRVVEPCPHVPREMFHCLFPWRLRIRPRLILLNPRDVRTSHAVHLGYIGLSVSLSCCRIYLPFPIFDVVRSKDGVPCVGHWGSLLHEENNRAPYTAYGPLPAAQSATPPTPSCLVRSTPVEPIFDTRSSPVSLVPRLAAYAGKLTHREQQVSP